MCVSILVKKALSPARVAVWGVTAGFGAGGMKVRPGARAPGQSTGQKGRPVGAWRGGTRRTLVVELWDGPTCVGNHRCMGSSGEERGGSRRVLPQADGSDAVSEVEVAEHSQACLRWQRECYLGCWRGRAVSFHQQCLCQG